MGTISTVCERCRRELPFMQVDGPVRFLSLRGNAIRCPYCRHMQGIPDAGFERVDPSVNYILDPLAKYILTSPNPLATAKLMAREVQEVIRGERSEQELTRSRPAVQEWLEQQTGTVRAAGDLTKETHRLLYYLLCIVLLLIVGGSVHQILDRLPGTPAKQRKFLKQHGVSVEEIENIDPDSIGEGGDS